MRKRVVVGLILFVGGFLLGEVSYIVDIWIIRVIGGILWPVGMVMGINALMILKQKRKKEGQGDGSVVSSESE